MLVRLYHDAYAGLSREAWWLAIGVFVNRAGTMVLPFLPLYLVEQKGLAASTAGGIMMFYGTGSVLGTLAGGLLTDRIGPWRVQLCSLLGAAVLLLVLGYMHHVAAIAGVAFSLALVGDAIRPASQAATALVCDEATRARGVALNRMAANLGISIGPFIGGLLAAHDYFLLFVADAATCFAAALWLYWVFSRTPLAQGRPEQPAPGARVSLVKVVRRDRLFATMLVLNVMFAVGFFQLLSVFFVYMKQQQYGFNEAQIGALVSLNCMIVVVAEMPIVARLGMHQLPQSLLAGGLTLAIGWALLPLSNHVIVAIAVIAFVSAGEIGWMPMLATWMMTRGPPALRGAYVGLCSASFAFAQLLAPLIGLWLYEHGGPHSPFIVTAWLAGLSGIIGFMVLRKNKPSFPSQSR